MDEIYKVIGHCKMSIASIQSELEKGSEKHDELIIRINVYLSMMQTAYAILSIHFDIVDKNGEESLHDYPTTVDPLSQVEKE